MCNFNSNPLIETWMMENLPDFEHKMKEFKKSHAERLGWIHERLWFEFIQKYFNQALANNKQKTTL